MIMLVTIPFALSGPPALRPRQGPDPLPGPCTTPWVFPPGQGPDTGKAPEATGGGRGAQGDPGIHQNTVSEDDRMTKI